MISTLARGLLEELPDCLGRERRYGCNSPIHAGNRVVKLPLRPLDFFPTKNLTGKIIARENNRSKAFYSWLSDYRPRLGHSQVALP